ncbi:sensor histidine kinase [Haloplanus rallus]|uniref:histidine kinase n=1 Tax=Haloplanus rallus TaxID=1816183 RepID=A0A6B9FEE1_9EURY|nr:MULTISPECIES: HAMP domain-containing sensor histidine kinase [Haloplanus]QGX93703.1 sensor histidine kinase [Haloplanus rallus]
MDSKELLPAGIRSRYAVKLFAVSLLITAVIVAGGSAIAGQVSDRVTEEQLDSVEANAELEAESLARWFEGEQESIRLLSSHRGIDPSNRTRTETTLDRELNRTSDELVSLHVVERPTEQPSNGTTERIVASSDGLAGEPLAATAIDWGQTASGEEVAFRFDSPTETLVSWVYLDQGNMSVAIASPTRDGDHVLIGEYHPSTRVAAAADATNDTSTVVLGGVSGYVMFEKNSPNEFHPYKGEATVTEVESRIEERPNQFAPISGAELDDTEVRGYHSVPSDGVNWVVVKEVPTSTALAVTDQVQTDLTVLIGLTAVGFLLISGMIHFGPISSIRRLSRQAEAIAEGDLTAEIPDGNRIDEVGQLRTSLHRTKAYIETITEQAEKIARREFDDTALDEEIPGPVGTAMADMRDDLERFVEEREQREQRLEVFNRLLRHNLRNRLDVIRSHAEQLADRTEGDDAEAVLAATDRLASIGTRARRIDRLMARDPDPATVDITVVVSELLSRTASDDVTVNTEFPPTATLRTDAEILRTALTSPLENAVGYAESSVTVSITSTADGYRIAISDDGPGIPVAELESLAAGTESSLQHGRGLGLWQLKWGIDALDGDLSFETEDGTTVEITLADLTERTENGNRAR